MAGLIHITYERPQREIKSAVLVVAGCLASDKENGWYCLDTCQSEVWLDWLANAPCIHALRRQFVEDSALSLWWLTRGAEKQPQHPFIQHLTAMANAKTIIPNHDEIVIVVPKPRDVDIWCDWVASAFPSYGVKTTLPSFYWLCVLKEKVGLIHRAVSDFVSSLFQHRFLTHMASVMQGKSAPTCTTLCLYQMQNQDGIYKHANYYLDPLVEALGQPLNIQKLPLKGRNLFNQREFAALLSHTSLSPEATLYPWLYPGKGKLFPLLMKWAKHILQLWKVEPSSEAWSYLGGNARRLVMDELIDFLCGRYFHYLYFRSCLQALYSAVGCKYVFYRSEFFDTGKLISSSAIPGVTMMAVQHGVVPPNKWLYAFQAHEIPHTPTGETVFVDTCPCPDLFLAFGRRMYDFMTSFGYPGEKIKITGSVRHHYLHRPIDVECDSENTRAIKKHYGLPSHKPVIGVFGQWPEATARWVRRALVLAESCGVTIILRIHPQFRSKTIDALNKMEDCEQSCVVIDSSLNDFMTLCDGCLGHSSTTLLEAVSQSMPCGCLNDAEVPLSNALYQESDAFYTIDGQNDMRQFFNEIALGKGEYLSKVKEEGRRFSEYHFENVRSHVFENIIALCD